MIWIKKQHRRKGAKRGEASPLLAPPAVKPSNKEINKNERGGASKAQTRDEGMEEGT